MSKSDGSFRVGRVKVYRRGQVWYLDYHEDGKRHRPRVGTVRPDAKRLAATVNAQLENGEPAATSFESLSLPELRRRWLEHHEHVRRSSLATINRYRTATDHLLRFVAEVKPVKRADQFSDRHAEAFVRYLRQLEVAPNGHANTAKRKLRGKGLKYVLEACRTLFNFAIKRRHLPPYTDNPFTVIEIDRVPVEDERVMVMPNDEQQRVLLEAADGWAQPIFITLMLTGMRPGELVHLLVSDVELEEGWLRVRSKPSLGWRTKTRNERSIPLVPELHAMLERVIGERTTGPIFLRHRYMNEMPPLIELDEAALAKEVQRRVKVREQELGRSLDRTEHAAVCRTVWRDMGAIKTDRIANVFKARRQVSPVRRLAHAQDVAPSLCHGTAIGQH